jgi:hypothetical protein
LCMHQFIYTGFGFALKQSHFSFSPLQIHPSATGGF